MTREDNENNMKNMKESMRNDYEIKINQKTNKNSYLNKNTKKNKVGPGTYDYTSERYPWVKPSFNAKYI